MKEKILNFLSFENIIKFLIIILPFHVLFSVFLEYKVWLHWVWIYKELLLIVLMTYLWIHLFIKKQIPKLDIIDYSILWYIIYLILISLVNYTWLKAIIYWWRYDFEFLLIFLIVRHWRFLLKEKISYYVRLFVISWSLALLIGILVRFVFKETILIHFWFSPVLSSWNFIDWVPIYHWIEWANVRRFQWIFDWPNQTAFFLIFYASMIYNYWRNKKDYVFYLFLVLFIVWWLIILTYSRSALLWVFGWLWLLVLLNLKLILKKYRMQSLVTLIIIFILGWFFYIRYGWHVEEIILRAWSSKWHSERMIIWFKQFLSNPMWQWLASSGPWYRATYNPKAENEKYFIPESWYVQQLVEWWIIGFVFFMTAMLFILIRIYPVCKPLFFAFFGVLTMNVVLHTFETSYVAILLFLFLWLFLSKKQKSLNN